MEKKTKTLRRSLSGIYIMHAFPGEDKPSPTCVEDCPEGKAREFIDSLDPEGLARLIAICYGGCAKIMGDPELTKFSDDPIQDAAARSFFVSHIKDFAEKCRDLALPEGILRRKAAKALRKLREVGDILDIKAKIETETIKD